MSVIATQAGIEASVSFEIIDVLDEFFVLRARSATLEGSAPLKAVQFCAPFIQGNAAGFHLLFGDSAVIQRSRQGVSLGLTEEGHAKSANDYAAKIENLVARGFLSREGFWHQKLRKGFSWTERGKLHVWTRYLIRPARGVWILVSGAFNRRCPIDVDEYVIPDTDVFVPLLVSLDLASANEKETWLEKELACLVPMRPDVTFTTCPLSADPEFGRTYSRYFDEKWDDSGPGKYVGAYRTLTQGEPLMEESDPAACRLVIAGGPDIHEVGTFDRFATADGWSRQYDARKRLQHILLRNIFDVTGRWDGHAVRDLVGEPPVAVQRLRKEWVRLYGEQVTKSLDLFLALYVRSTHGPRIGEPYLMFTAWVFVATPAGWSSLVDGFHFDDIDGLRGVISTDRYHSIIEVFQFLRPCDFEFRRGVPLMRVLPVPRRLLRSTFRKTSLDAD